MQSNTCLGLVSIILIISILLLVYYKNVKDNNIEGFYDDLDNTLRENNTLLNKTIDNITSTEIKIVSDPDIITQELYSKISNDALAKSASIATKYESNNKTNDTAITILENKVTDLENIINNKKQNKLSKIKYSVIKSLNNGMEMDLFSTPNTSFKDKKTGVISDSALVGFNNGCLSVSANDYDVYKCNDKNPKQFFKLHHILNDTEYKKNIDKVIDFDKIDKSKINYPFAIVKSNNNDNCLTNNHGNITVQPCYAFEAQRWLPL